MPAMTDLRAAELKILAGGSTTGWMNELAAQFERASGHKLVIHFDSTPNLIKQATSGAPFDLAVVPVDVFKDAAARARFAAGPTIDIARVGYGVIVRTGAPKPDIGTSEALKKTLLDAPSIAFVPESAAGAHVLKTFDRLGIGEAMKAKTKPQAMPAQIAPSVAKGEAELGVFLVNVLIAPGVELGRRLSGRIAAGAGFLRRRRGGLKECGSRQGVHRFSDHSRRQGRHQGQGHEPWLSGRTALLDIP